MYYVYVLRSEVKNYHYVWMTNNIERRLTQHNEWKNQSTKAYLPFKILYTEIVEDGKQARKREKYWKSWVGKEMLKTK